MAKEPYYGDAPEDIQKCLSCTKPRCNDCLRYQATPRLNSKCVPVQQLNRETGEVITVFPSVAEATRHTNIHKSQIYACLRGTLPQAGGFGWRKLKEVESADV